MERDPHACGRYLMTLTADAVRDVLRDVPEPCSLLMGAPTNITDMGLVGDVVVAGAVVSVELVLTDASCVHFAAMTRYVQDLVGALDGVERVHVTASTSTMWTPERAVNPSRRARQDAPRGASR